MRRSNYFSDNEQLRSMFTTGERFRPYFDALGLSPAEREQTLSTWRDVLDLAGRYVGEEVAQRAQAVDAAAVTYTPPVTTSAPMLENLRGLAALGLMGLGIPEAHGGFGLPMSVNMAFVEMLARACSSTMVQQAFYTTPASMIVHFGTEDQKRRYVPDLAAGRRIGAVAMTEPRAGSDVAAVATYADRSEDGTWRIHGRKQFISSGNGDFVLVLARSDRQKQSTFEGLSMFIVERRLEDGTENYLVEKAEHKNVIKGSPTCSLVFEGARAELLGEAEGQGWAQIVAFMNEARLGVGTQGLGICQAALVAASDYAAERQQMGRPIREHPVIADMLLDMRASTEALRALIYRAALEYDLSARGDQRATQRLRELTPLVKWLGAEEAVRLSRSALQVHGGYGVVVEYDVERLTRDAKVTAIYEGTSQIQSLMAVKDIAKRVAKRPQRLLFGDFTTYLREEIVTSEAARLRNEAREMASGALRTLLWRAFTGGRGLRGAFALLRGRRPSEDDLGELLEMAERVAGTLALIAASGELAAAGTREDLDLRTARRARMAAQKLAFEVHRPERSALVQARTWQRERTGTGEDTRAT